MKWDIEKDILGLMVGHGKSINGAWDSGCVYGKYTEAALMLSITKVAVAYLRGSGIKVLTDADKDNNRNMISCVKWANAKGADLYISMHCDWKRASAGVWPQYVSAAGKKASKAIGKAVAKEMGMKYKGLRCRSDLYELNGTDMPAVVFETGAIKADLKYLKQSERYGKAMAKAVCSYLGVAFKNRKVA